MSTCEDGHTTQPCPGCGICITWRTSYGTTPKATGWVEHDGTPHRCRTTSGVNRIIEAARGADDCIEKLDAAVWDAHYGKRISAGYARECSGLAKDALDALRNALEGDRKNAAKSQEISIKK